MKNEFENDFAGDETPVDTHVNKLLAASEDPKCLSKWRILPDSANGKPRYQYIDSEGISTVLTCVEKTDKHLCYTMQCKKRGNQIMFAREWNISQQHSTLGTLYDRIAQHVHRKDLPQESPPQQEKTSIQFFLLGLWKDDTPKK